MTEFVARLDVASGVRRGGPAGEILFSLLSRSAGGGWAPESPKVSTGRMKNALIPFIAVVCWLVGTELGVLCIFFPIIPFISIYTTQNNHSSAFFLKILEAPGVRGIFPKIKPSADRFGP